MSGLQSLTFFLRILLMVFMIFTAIELLYCEWFCKSAEYLRDGVHEMAYYAIFFR